MHPMVLLRDVGLVEACFGPFGDSVNLGARLVHNLRRMYHKHGNHFGHIRWHSNVMLVKWKLFLVYLEIVLISGQYRGTLCAEHTIGPEIILDAPDGTPT